jgi:hypothetical protein
MSPKTLLIPMAQFLACMSDIARTAAQTSRTSGVYLTLDDHQNHRLLLARIKDGASSKPLAERL